MIVLILCGWALTIVFGTGLFLRTGRSITVNRRLAVAVQVQDSLAARALYMQREMIYMYNYLTTAYPTMQAYMDTLAAMGYALKCDDQ